MPENSFHNVNALVMGLGRFGGAVGAARYLASRGARVTVTDMGDAESLAQSVAKLADLPITLHLGGHQESDFRQAQLVVVNPAVQVRGNRYLQAATESGATITSEMSLVAQRLPNRRQVIGVTGTAGKSTVTAMIGHILQTCLPDAAVYVGGNIGGSLLDEIDQIQPNDFVVLELSSFMLEMLAADRWSPGIAVATNLSPNHLDRHGTIESYAAAKQVIFDSQASGDAAVLTDQAAMRLTPRIKKVKLVHDLEDLEDWPHLPLPGKHNLINAHLAVEAAACAGVARDQAVASLASFRGLPHRLQMVGEREGVTYFNDSKATTPDAAYLALTGFKPGVVHLIVGGDAKGADLRPLAAFAAGHCRAIYTVGAAGDDFADIAQVGDAEVVRSGTVDQAVADSATRVRRGDVVLLSPACASWDQFDNYQQRGGAFVEAMLNYTGEGAPPPTTPRSSAAADCE